MQYQVDQRLAARRGGDDTDEPIETAEGVIAAVDGDVITMGTRTYDPADGWLFEVIDRATTFPESLCEIDALLHDGDTVRLMGKGDLWTDTATGQVVTVDKILSFQLVEES